LLLDDFEAAAVGDGVAETSGPISVASSGGLPIFTCL
jgi:hypothetical protein